jgi:hypothetical protein
MNSPLERYAFQITPLFEYIQSQAKAAGLWIHWEKAKEALQLFENEESFRQKKRYFGAMQYEGSKDFAQKEPHTVSFRFKRSNLPAALRTDLEKITTFRRDKNQGPPLNPLSESIAFKFQQLGEQEKATIEEITCVLKKYCN